MYPDGMFLLSWKCSTAGTARSIVRSTGAATAAMASFDVLAGIFIEATGEVVPYMLTESVPSYRAIKSAPRLIRVSYCLLKAPSDNRDDTIVAIIVR